MHNKLLMVKNIILNIVYDWGGSENGDKTSWVFSYIADIILINIIDKIN